MGKGGEVKGDEAAPQLKFLASSLKAWTLAANTRAVAKS